MTKDLFGIPAIVSVNVINYGINYLDYKNCKCRNKIVDKLLEDCSENFDGKCFIINETLDAIPLIDYKKVVIPAQYT